MIDKILKFLKEVELELKKVSWPSRKEAFKLTLAVIIGAGIIAILISLFDYLFLKAFEFFLNM